VGVGIAGAGCAGKPIPCVSSAACGPDTVCVAGRCREGKDAPVPASAQRLVLEPVAMAVVSSSGTHERNTSIVSFGKASWGDVVLLLRFAAPFGETTQILSAHVVLDRVPRFVPGPQPVRLQVARIVEPWSAAQASWATLPQLRVVNTTFWASTWGERPLRIDVTEQVQRWREHRRDEQGLAIVSSPQNEIGETYSLGLLQGRGPRLDVYLR